MTSLRLHRVTEVSDSAPSGRGRGPDISGASGGFLQTTWAGKYTFRDATFCIGGVLNSIQIRHCANRALSSLRAGLPQP